MLNGKSLDLRLRLAPGFDALEPGLRAKVTQHFRRGNISAALTVTRTAPVAMRVNREALAQLVSLMNELADEIDAAPPRLDGLLALRGVVETIEDDEEAVIEKRRSAVLGGWETALDRLAAARAEEERLLSSHPATLQIRPPLGSVRIGRTERRPGPLREAVGTGRQAAWNELAGCVEGPLVPD